MGKSIKHFMWGYQLHFRISQEVLARSLFELLDKRFDPEVFLVGIRIEDQPGRYPACVEPEEDFWIPSETFNTVLEAAKDLTGTYPESEISHSHPLAQRWHDERLSKRAIRETISGVIGGCPDKPLGMQYSVSYPAMRDGYLVSVALGLQEEVINSCPRLSIDRANIHEYRSFKVTVSLIDAAAEEFLSDGASQLVKPDPGAAPLSGKSLDEILRAAGSRLMRDIVYKADSHDDSIGYWERLFDAFNRISALKYEQAVGKGLAVIARRDHPSLTPTVTFDQAVSVHNARGARKLLELASQGPGLHMNARYIFGLVEVGQYPAKDEDLYEVNVLGHHHWELAHAGKALMHVRSGQPQLRAPTFNKNKLRKHIPRVFPGIAGKCIDLLVSLAEAADKQKHGTMLVVVDDPAAEAERLSNQATCIKPCTLTPELLTHLTGIDGAVLMGSDGTAHAIGVILDGLATKTGNPARGARFNSAVRYVETHEQRSLAIVVSEDGGVDVIPDLRPAIRRSKLEEAITELEALLADAHINRRRYRKLMESLEGKRFYLAAKHCQKLNALVKRFDERIAKEDPEAPRIIRQEFLPNLDFDPGLYYEEEGQAEKEDGN